MTRNKNRRRKGQDVKLTSEQQAVKYKQRQQIIRRPKAQRRAMQDLVSCTFLASSRGIDFASPFVPVGKATLVVLSRHVRPSGNHKSIEQSYLRGYSAEFDPDTGVTHWGPATARFAYDLGLTMHPRATKRMLPLENVGLARIGLDLDRAASRAAGQPFRLSGGPILPPTLLAFPDGAKVEPERTPFVEHVTKTRGFSDWEAAWYALFEELQVPNEINDVGLPLIDSRICTRVRASGGYVGALRLYHDFREFLGDHGRPVRNVARDVTGKPLQLKNPVQAVLQRMGLKPKELGELDEAQLETILADVRRRLGDFSGVFSDNDLCDGLLRPSKPLIGPVVEAGSELAVAAMRRSIPPRISAGCDDDDLLFASHEPHAPLIASKISRIQVWRVASSTSSPETFQFQEHGQSADLWHVRPAWMQGFEPRKDAGRQHDQRKEATHGETTFAAE